MINYYPNPCFINIHILSLQCRATENPPRNPCARCVQNYLKCEYVAVANDLHPSALPSPIHAPASDSETTASSGNDIFPSRSEPLYGSVNDSRSDRRVATPRGQSNRQGDDIEPKSLQADQTASHLPISICDNFQVPSYFTNFNPPQQREYTSTFETAYCYPVTIPVYHPSIGEYNPLWPTGSACPTSTLMDAFYGDSFCSSYHTSASSHQLPQNNLDSFYLSPGTPSQRR